jgi:hypothetical protein
MRKYFFITPEGLSFKPSMDSPEPDSIDLEIFRFNRSITVQDTVQDLMKLNYNFDDSHTKCHFITSRDY